MRRIDENERFAHFRATGEPDALAAVFDATAPELLRVAAHLSNGNRELVQDALQATFLTAIEDAEQWDEDRAVRPWLLGILANHVRKARRQLRKHGGPDAATLALVTGATDTTGSPSRAAEQREFSAAAHAAMQELAPPFREVIVLHLHHGLTAREIGDALGRPAGTVRTQIVRGLERLRGRLPAGFAGLAGLGATLLSPERVLAAVRHEVLGSLPMTVSSSGLFFASWRLPTMIATAVAATLAVLVPLFFGADPAPPPVEPAATATSEGAAPASAPLARQLVAAAEAPIAEEAKPIQDPQPAFDPQRPTVEFTVVYEDGERPAANVPIGIMLHHTLEQWQTDAAGKLEVALPWPGYHEVFVLGTLTRQIISWPEFTRPLREKETHRLVIPRGMTLAVRVVDADGDPVAGAVVEASHGSQPGQMLSPFGRTGADGRIVREHVTPRGQLRAWADGHVPSRIVDAGGTVGQQRAVTLQLPGPGLAVRGAAHDETGKPLAHAHLAFVQLLNRPLQPQFVTTDAKGHFSIGALDRGNHALTGIHTEDGVTRRGHLRFSLGGDSAAVLDFALTRGARVEGRLTDVKGNALGNTNVVARDRPEGIHALPFLETWTRTDRNGSFVIDGLTAGRYELECEHCESRLVDLVEGEVATWNPQRAPVQPIDFRLLDANGQPLVGWQALIIPPGNAFPRGGTITGDDGRPRVSAPSRWSFPAGSFAQLAFAPKLGKNPNESDDFPRWPCLVTPPLAVGMEHEIRVPDHARQLHRLTGSVRDSTGQPVDDTKVRLQGVFGSVFRLTLRPDADTGAFVAEDLVPGRYRAFVAAPGRPTLALPAIDARGGGTIALGEIVLPELGQLTVTIAPPAPGEAAAAPTRVEIIGPGSSEQSRPLRRSDDGTWRATRLFRGSYLLRAWSGVAWAPPERIEVDGDDARATVTLQPHTPTTITVELPADQPRNTSAWKGDLVARDEHGHTLTHKLREPFYGTFRRRLEFEVPLPAGQHTLKVRGWTGRRGAGSCTVPAGGGGAARIVIE